VYGGYAAHEVKVGAHDATQTKVSRGDDRCSKQLCRHSGHHLDRNDCCGHCNLSLFALTPSIAGQNKLLFFDFEKPVFAGVTTFLCTGYHSIWLPPKVV